MRDLICTTTHTMSSTENDGDNNDNEQLDETAEKSNVTTRHALDSGFRSCSEGESPGYLSAAKLRLCRQLSGVGNPQITLRYADSTNNHDDEVFSDSDTSEVFFAASSLNDEILRSRRRQNRANVISLPSEPKDDKNTCRNSQCHCPACCACISEKNKTRTNCISLNHDKADTYFGDSSFINSILPAPSSPTMISSWGHYNRHSGLHYKYARSDYSSDSDDDSMFTRRKSRHKLSHTSNVSHMTFDYDPVAVDVTPSTSFDDIGASCSGPVDYPTTSADLTPPTDDVPFPRLSPKIVLQPPIHWDLKSKKSPDISTRNRDLVSESKKCDKTSKPPVDPVEFRSECQKMETWFTNLTDENRNIALRRLLHLCDLPQMHLLSVKLQDRLHHGCPINCEDIITWVPANLATKVFTFLDPESLCRASQVCQIWYNHASNASLWRRFCCQAKWRLSKPAEHKQVVRHMSPVGSIQWKRVFAERFRLRKNWLNGRCSVRTFEGHTQGISCVQFDDTRIVSGSSDKTIKVWNIRTNAPWSVQTLVGHSGTVRCLHLEGNKLVSGSTDRSIKVWDLSTQESWSSIACKVTMVGHTDTVRCLQVDDEKVISGSYDKTLKIWDIRTGECRTTLRGHLAAVLCVYFNDSKIVSGSCDKTIKVWDHEKCLMTLEGHQDAVTCLQFDSTRIISGSLDCTLKFWDMHTGRCVNTIDWRDSEGHTGVVRCLQADAWRLVSAADDKTLKVWNLETGERLVTLKNHTDGVTCMQFNDFVIVSGSYDKTVKLWDFSCC